ncbi:MAG: 6,7-dimethyl-8-ribityllumazine synthase [Halothiobacillaceae bacterium]
MSSMRVIEGNLTESSARYAILATRWNELVVDVLVKGAVDALKRHGVSEEAITIIRVPGAYELPLVAQRAAATEDYDAIICLGAVIRGATPHFDYVAGEAAKGIASVSMDYELPVIFGVLTTENLEQAFERAGTKAGNKGAEAATVAIEMVSLLRKLDVRE